MEAKENRKKWEHHVEPRMKLQETEAPLARADLRCVAPAGGSPMRPRLLAATQDAVFHTRKMKTKQPFPGPSCSWHWKRGCFLGMLCVCSGVTGEGQGQLGKDPEADELSGFILRTVGATEDCIVSLPPYFLNLIYFEQFQAEVNYQVKWKYNKTHICPSLCFNNC